MEALPLSAARRPSVKVGSRTGCTAPAGTCGPTRARTRNLPPGTIAAFETALAQVDEVRQAERLFGDPDYLVGLATADIDEYQRVRDEKLATLPGVQRLTSTMVMKGVVADRPLPTARAASPGPRRG